MTLSLPWTSTLLKFPNNEFKKLTSATAMTSQIRTTIGWIRKNNPTARAARFLVAILRCRMPNNDVKFWNVLFGRHRRDPQQSLESFILHLCQKRSLQSSERTIRLFLTRWSTRHNHKTLNLVSTLSSQQQQYLHKFPYTSLAPHTTNYFYANLNKERDIQINEFISLSSVLLSCDFNTSMVCKLIILDNFCRKFFFLGNNERDNYPKGPIHMPSLYNILANACY